MLSRHGREVDGVAYDEDLANRVREALSDADVDPVEREMFGGLAFMVDGHMTVGIIGDELMVRVGRDAHHGALAEPHTREMDFTGRPMTGMVYVTPEGLGDDEDLAAWIQRALEHTRSLPPR